MLQTFTDFIQSIFGQYQPIEIIDSTTGQVIDSAVDFGYIAAVICLLVFVYFVLKTLGGLLYEWLR